MSTATASNAGRQNMLALQRANRIRLARAAMKRRIAAGDVSVADVLVEPTDEIEGMEIIELLASQKRWGVTRCSKFLDAIGLPETKTVRSMTARQRTAVAEVLRSRRPTAELNASVVFRAAA
ncbi:MAG: hypothetical protein JHC87_10310 [Thermoleophilaceae bacterium]|nr:hypothetical protein [Thermoleophilaceae bacterium]